MNKALWICAKVKTCYWEHEDSKLEQRTLTMGEAARSRLNTCSQFHDDNGEQREPMTWNVSDTSPA